MSDDISKLDPGWVGTIVLAGVATLISGVLNVIYGLGAIFAPNWDAFSTEGLIFFDITGLGWFSIFLGVALVGTGLGILLGSDVARLLGVVFATANLIINVAEISNFPEWSIVLIVMDLILISALLAPES